MKKFTKLFGLSLILGSIILVFMYIKDNTTSETKITEVMARIVDKRYVNSIHAKVGKVSITHKEKYLVILEYDDKEYSFNNKIVYDKYKKYDQIRVQLVSSYNKKGRLISQKIKLTKKW